MNKTWPASYVAEVAFLTWTADGLVRQVVYEGLREDKTREVRRECQQKRPPTCPSGGLSLGVKGPDEQGPDPINAPARLRGAGPQGLVLSSRRTAIARRGSVSPMTITSQQVKAARELLGWSQAELATKAGMTLIAIQVLESRDWFAVLNT